MDLGCLKCGRETISEQVFCVNCLADMSKYPVLPGTVVQLPLRKDPVPVKKQPAKKRSVSPEEQIRNLKHRCRVLTLLVVLLAWGLTTANLVAMLVADLAAVPMQNTAIPLINGLVPMLTVMGLELILSHLSLRSIRLRKLLCGKPVILIDNGKIVQQNLARTQVTLDELSGHLREKDVLDIQTVQYAILETNGNLSVFPYPAEQPAIARDAGVKVSKQYLPVTLVSDGRLLAENLKKAKKDGAWLHKVLRERNATLEGTWLLTVDEGNRVYYIPKEEKT